MAAKKAVLRKSGSKSPKRPAPSAPAPAKKKSSKKSKSTAKSKPKAQAKAKLRSSRVPAGLNRKERGKKGGQASGRARLKKSRKVAPGRAGRKMLQNGSTRGGGGMKGVGSRGGRGGT